MKRMLGSWLGGLVGLGLVGCGAAAPGEMASDAAGAGYEPPAAMAPPADMDGVAEKAAPSPARASSGPTMAESMTSVRAGEWDDNANYRDFLGYVGQQARLGIDKMDVGQRRFLVALDANGKGIPSCAVTVTDAQQRSARLVTTASGRALFFPAMMGLSGSKYTATSSCLQKGDVAKATFEMADQDGAVPIVFRGKRSDVSKPAIDVLFVLDTTGSMSEEIEGVKDTLRAVVGKLDGKASVRAGVVEYKDRTDDLVTKVYPMTRDLSALSTSIKGLSASGGGDTPEDLNSALAVAMRDVAWDDQAVARIAFVIADAPPHLDYENVPKYSESAKKAAQRGVKLFTVSASGMDDMGQAVFRQIAQATGGTNMFVLRGGAGPQSTGAGDAKSSCGTTHQDYSSGNLDELIVKKIALELASLKANPMQIPGMGEDEKAKPCEKRIMLVAD
jgi:Mg-chelatase subunit ChlD